MPKNGFTSPRVVAKRVEELEKRLFELWRHESYLATMVLSHLRQSGEDVPPEPEVGKPVVEGRDLDKRDRVIEAILAERKFQDARWGSLAKQNKRNPLTWLACIEEELEEAKEAFFTNSPEAFLEVVQVAAVAFAFLEQLAPMDISELVNETRQKKMEELGGKATD
jgi:hypothetical protein